MAQTKSYVRFFTYLALFSSSMLGTVISPNTARIYVLLAELVAELLYLCCIGFWYDRDGAPTPPRRPCVTGWLIWPAARHPRPFVATGSFASRDIGLASRAALADGQRLLTGGG